MKGLQEAEAYFKEVGLPRLEKAFPELLPRMAFGLVGEGSECFGYDDEISRDHDWGAGFYIWLTDQDYQAVGSSLKEFYQNLPTQGFHVRQISPQGTERCGVMRSSVFFYRYLGRYSIPEESIDWLSIPEESLALVTNGRVFRDDLGEFSHIRKAFGQGYPRDVFLKKLAAKLAKAARAGQYQYPRCLRRGDQVAALLALTDFLNDAMGICYLLAGRYMPYFKWRWRGLMEIDLPEGIRPEDFLQLSRQPYHSVEPVEGICVRIADELRRRELSGARFDFLQEHALEVFGKIEDSNLKKLHFMTE